MSIITKGLGSNTLITKGYGGGKILREFFRAVSKITKVFSKKSKVY